MSKDSIVDRAGWPPGPWDNEPDRIEWRYQGLACLIVRNDMGALCGYVGVPIEKKELFAEVELAAHGDITFAGPCKPDGDICHTPRPGEGEVFWFGFDCCHLPDLIPSFTYHPEDGVYRDVAWVREEVHRLARQCLEVLQ